MDRLEIRKKLAEIGCGEFFFEGSERHARACTIADKSICPDCKNKLQILVHQVSDDESEEDYRKELLKRRRALSQSPQDDVMVPCRTDGVWLCPICGKERLTDYCVGYNHRPIFTLGASEQRIAEIFEEIGRNYVYQNNLWYRNSEEHRKYMERQEAAKAAKLEEIKSP